MKAPVFFLNGKSSVFGRTCSSENTTKLLANHLQHAHFQKVYHLSMDRALATHAWNRERTEVTACRLVQEIERVCGGKIPEEGVDIIVHSKGGLFSKVMMDLVTPKRLFNRVIMFSPAMGREQEWGHLDFGHVYCIHNKHDRAILSGLLLPLGHPFGNAGRRGFKTDDSRVTNIPRHERGWGLKHNHYFHGDNLEHSGHLCAALLENKL